METCADLFLRQQYNLARQKAGNILITRTLFPKLCQKCQFYKDYLTSQKTAVILHAQIGYDRNHMQLKFLIILGALSTLIYVYFLTLSKYFHVSASK